MYPKSSAIQDLTTYFARPVTIATGSLLSSLTRANLIQFATGTDLISVFPDGVHRLDGVYGYRATMVFTLQVAATPFHQGVLSLNFQYGTLADTVLAAPYLRSSKAFTSTNIPHVRMDLSVDTMVQLRVPMILPSEYATLSGKSYGQIGAVAINPILSVPTVAGISAPTYHLYLHLEDLELFGARPYEANNVVLQAGGKMAVTAREFEDEAYPYSSAASALSRTLRFVGKGIPALSSITGPTSWFLSKAAGAIRSFGYARPALAEPITRVHHYGNIGEQNIDVAYGAQVVAATSTNSLAHGPNFGLTDVDEMSLKYVLSQWNQIFNFPVRTTDAANTLMYICPVTPSTMWYRDGGTAPFCNLPIPEDGGITSNAFQPSGLCFFGSMFKFWRGSIKFRFTVSKTKMHGGRLMVNYYPSGPNSPNDWAGTVPTVPVGAMGVLGPDPAGVSAIYNLRDGNIFEFEVPYMCASPYLTYNSYPGVLGVYVVDALQAPAIVSNTARVLVEVCAGDDFELSDPIGPMFPTTPKPTFRLQSGKVISNVNEKMVEYTMGESITSLKQLISMPKTTFASSLANPPPPDMWRFDMPPWHYQPQPSALIPAPTTNISESLGFGGVLASAFAFVRGGTDYHVYFSDTADNLTQRMVQVIQDPKAFGAESATNSPANRSTTNVPRVMIVNPTDFHVRCPAFHPMMRYTSACANSVHPAGFSWSLLSNTSSTYSTEPSEDCMPNIYTLLVSDITNTQLAFSRCASDDAAMSGYMGPPPLFLLSVHNNAVDYDPDVKFST